MPAREAEGGGVVSPARLVSFSPPLLVVSRRVGVFFFREVTGEGVMDEKTEMSKTKVVIFRSLSA